MESHQVSFPVLLPDGVNHSPQTWRACGTARSHLPLSQYDWIKASIRTRVWQRTPSSNALPPSSLHWMLCCLRSWSVKNCFFWKTTYKMSLLSDRLHWNACLEKSHLSLWQKRITCIIRIYILLLSGNNVSLGRDYFLKRCVVEATSLHLYEMFFFFFPGLLILWPTVFNNELNLNSLHVPDINELFWVL